MPILWRYLLKSYFQVLSLCVSSFIAILLVTRFQEIARFATSGAGIMPIILFGLYQIPYILPIAIPFSCLIAAMLLYQRLSHAHELTAFRSSGLGLYPIVFPLLLASAFLSLLNFSIASEISPLCRSLSRELIYKMTAQNPLFLLQKETLVRLKDCYIDMKALKSGQNAEEVIFVASSNGRLNLMSAKELSINGDLLVGKNVTLISSVDPKKGEGFDHLIIENQKTMNTKASNMVQFVEKFETSANYDYLPLRMILASERLSTMKGSGISGRAYMEIAKRISLGLAAFTFTLIGCAFGVEISRHHSKRGVIWAIALASTFLITFISAKSFRDAPMLASLIYLAPHPVIILICLKSLRRVAEGKE